MAGFLDIKTRDYYRCERAEMLPYIPSDAKKVSWTWDAERGTSDHL